MFIRHWDLLDHLYLVHKAIPQPTCKDCGNTYSRQRGLQRHRQEKHRTKFTYTCMESPDCDFKVETRAKFVRHLQDKHDFGHNFICQYCDKVRYQESGTLVSRVGNARFGCRERIAYFSGT